MRRAAFIVALLVAAGARAQLVTPILNYATTDAGGEYLGINPGPYSQTCAVCSVASTQDGGFWFGIGQVDPLNPSVPIGPQLDGGCGTPDGGAALCVNTLDGGSGAVAVPWSCDAGLCIGVTLSTVNSQAAIVGPAGPTGPTGPSGGGGISDGGLYVNGPLTVDGGVDVLAGCYATPAGCTVCDDGQNLVLSPLPDGGVVVAKGGVYSDGGIQASSLDAGTVNSATLTAGFEDAGQVDAVLGVFGALDAGVLNAATITATAETVTSLTATAESAGFLDAGVVQAAFLDAGQVDTGLLVCAEIDAGTVNAVVETVGFLDAGQVDAKLAVLGAIDAGAINAVTETAGFLDAGQVDATLGVFGAIDAGTINAATETVGFLDAGQLDAVLAVIGAIDAGAENVITITSVTATAITLTASMIDAGVVQAAFLDAGQIDTGLLVCSALDAGAVNAVVETAGFMDAGQVDTGLLVAGAIDAGVIAAVRETAGFMDAGQVDATLLVCGAIDAGVVMATFESLGLLDAGEICLQGVCETTWPSGGAQSNYFDGGVLMDGGSNLFTELTVIGGESVSGSLTCGGTVTGSTFISDVVQNNVGFECSFAGCQYSLDPSGFAYTAEADGGTKYVTADGGQAYFTGGNLFGVIVDGGGANYVELQGGNVTATGTLSVGGNLSQTNGTVSLNNGTNNSISMSGGTTAIDGNTASIMGAAGTSEFQCVPGSCGMLASDPLTLGASELAFGNDAGWIEGSQPGLIQMVGADGVASVVQVGNYQITGLPNNTFWAIYPGGVTPGSGNFSFLGDEAGTVETVLNNSSSTVLAVSNNTIVGASASGAAVTGTLKISSYLIPSAHIDAASSGTGISVGSAFDGCFDAGVSLLTGSTDTAGTVSLTAGNNVCKVLAGSPVFKISFASNYATDAGYAVVITPTFSNVVTSQTVSVDGGVASGVFTSTGIPLSATKGMTSFTGITTYSVLPGAGTTWQWDYITIGEGATAQ